jgi:DNA replication protein DnaC
MPISASIELLVRTGQSKRANAELQLPRRYRKKSLEDLIGRQQEIESARTAIQRGKGVYVFGPCGTGKTHFAVGVLCEWYADVITTWYYAAERTRAHKRGAFVSMTSLLLDIKQGYNGNKHSERELLRGLREIDLLLIDDLGAERLTDWSRAIISDLIAMRHSDMRPLIVTSNLDLDGISAAIDDRVSSRLAEMCEIVKLDGTDYRVTRSESQRSFAGVLQ